MSSSERPASSPSAPVPRQAASEQTPSSASRGTFPQFPPSSAASAAGLGGTAEAGAPAEERVVADQHTTNTGAVVAVVECAYSSGLRGYKVIRRTHAGTSGAGADEMQAPLLLRLMGVNDVLLLGVLAALLLPRVLALTSASVPLVQPERTRESLGWLLDSSFAMAALVCCAAALALRLVRAYRRVYVEEVVAIRGLGIQIRKYGLFGQVKSERFLSSSMIRSLVIHDAFFRYQPMFFLSATVENEARRVVFFDETLPRLAVLRPVLRGLRHILYGEPEHGLSLAELEQAGEEENAHESVEDRSKTDEDESSANIHASTLFEDDDQDL